MQRKLAMMLLGIFGFICTMGQNVKPRLNTLPLSSLSSFTTKGDQWKIVGSVQTDFTDTLLHSAAGEGILINDFQRAIHYRTAAPIQTNMEHGDLVLAFDFMIPKGGRSRVFLQSRYGIQIADSWGVELPKSNDMGGIYERGEKGNGFDGKAPLKNAGFAPGVWNHMEISFQAPRFDAAGKKIQAAKFIYVKLNGISLHENIWVSGPSRGSVYDDEKAYGPIAFQGDHGAIAIKNIQYAPQEELKVSLSDLKYSYFEKSAKTIEQAKKTKPTSTGTLTVFDSRVASARDQFFLNYEGNLTVPVRDNYNFTMLYSGDASLIIDGKPVIAPTWNHLGGYPIVGSTNLEGGTHTIQLWINKDLNWSGPGLSLFIEKPNSKAVALHSPASMPERVPAPLIAVQSTNTPELIRSFMDHKNKKLTHVLSVGDPHQVHYSYDLLQGGLLQVWKGDFLNTTEMWYERGEPQTATALGAAITLAGNSPVYEPTNTKDSITAYQYKGYSLDAKGLPTFKYTYKHLRLSDKLMALENRNGLSRTITIEGETTNSFIRIAQSSYIKSLGNGLYVIGDHQHFISTAPSVKTSIENYNGQQVLLVPTANTITYSIIW
ncbi:MAG: hypothetical protein RL642_1311 [Bacteroidota bacterium]